MQCQALWVGNVDPEQVSERHLIQLFSRCAKVDNVRLLPKRFCAFVNFSTPEGACTALEKLQVRLCLILSFHLIPRDTKDNRLNGQVGVPNKRNNQNPFVKYTNMATMTSGKNGQHMKKHNGSS